MNLHALTIQKISEHAQREYPFECCGIITGRGDSQAVHQCKNIQNRLHAGDPVTYQRDARTAYSIDRTEFDRIIDSAVQRGDPVTAFYHSHPEHEAFFSEEDAASQTALGEPEFPDVPHLVISVFSGRIADMRGYIWDGKSSTFRETNVITED